MKKIVHVTTVHTPFDTRIFLKQCRSLALHGYEVVLIAPHTHVEFVEGVRIKPVPRVRNRLLRMVLSSIRAIRAALQEKASLYHFHDPELLPAARLLRFLGCNVVFDMHENLPKAILTKRWIPKIFRKPASVVFRFFERLLLGRLPVVFAETSYREDYAWVKQQRVALNMPVIESIPLAVKQPTTPTVGYIGGVSADRGSQLTVEALELLKNAGVDVAFQCVGPISQEHRAELTQRAKGSGLNGVRFYGAMPASRGWEVIARCHIGLAVLKPLPNYIRSYPTKMFEYMAMGLPVIVTDVPLYRNVVDSAECGLCVDPEDPQALANALQWLTDNAEAAVEMGKRGRAAVLSRFSWEVEFKKLLSLYQELLCEDRNDRRCQTPIHQRSDSQPTDCQAA